MNDHNLTPSSKRSREQLQEMGRKGGIASGKTRRQQRELKKMLKCIMEKSEKT